MVSCSSPDFSDTLLLLPMSCLYSVLTASASLLFFPSSPTKTQCIYPMTVFCCLFVSFGRRKCWSVSEEHTVWTVVERSLALVCRKHWEKLNYQSLSFWSTVNWSSDCCQEGPEYDSLCLLSWGQIFSSDFWVLVFCYALCFFLIGSTNWFLSTAVATWVALWKV